MSREESPRVSLDRAGEPCAGSRRSQGRMLVIRGGAMGDFILTLPVLAALRRAFPSTHIEVLGYPRVAGLAVAAGYADGIRALESRELAGFFARRGELDLFWSEYFAGFNLVLSYLYDPDLFFQSNLARVSRAQMLVGRHRPEEGIGLHATQQLLRPLEQLAIFDADPSPHLPGMAVEKDELSRSNVRRVAIHPGSGSESKNWEESRWRELLLRWDTTTDWEVEVVGGDAEGERLDRLARGLKRVRVVRGEPLPDLARRLARNDLFVGHDSGVSHLAAASGARGLVLWGPTDEATWRPRSERFITLRHADGLGGLEVAVVDARVRELMGE